MTHDAGKQFVAKVFQTSNERLHIETKCVPIESPNFMSYVERYHQPICHAYNIVKSKAPDLDAEAALQIAVKYVNDSTSLDGLVPIILVCSTLPRLGSTSDKPPPSMNQRPAVLCKATEAMSRNFTNSQVFYAVRTRNGLDTSGIHSAPIGFHVLVYRLELDFWDGPFLLLEMKGETCTILLPPS